MKNRRHRMSAGGSAAANALIGVVLAGAVVVAVVAVLKTDPTGGDHRGLGRQFQFNEGDIRGFDPALVKYAEVPAGRIATGFAEARGIAVDARDRIYVAGDRAVRVFEANGKPAGGFAVGGPPRALAVAGDGTVYVGLTRHVEVFDAAGGRKAAWADLGPDAVITSIAVAGEDVFVADAGNRVVVRYDRSGGIVNRIGRRDERRHAGGLNVPSAYLDVAVHPDGVLRVVNPGRLRVEAYDPAGGIELGLIWGQGPSRDIQGFFGCCNPAHIAVLPDGGFVTAEKVVSRVKVYDAAGGFVGIVAGPDKFRKGTDNLDLAVDSNGRILVLDPAARAVRAFVLKRRPTSSRSTTGE